MKKVKSTATEAPDVRARLRKAMATADMPHKELAALTGEDETEDIWVTTQQDVADALGVTRERIVIWNRQPGSPRKHKGKHNLVEWREWALATGKSIGGTGKPVEPSSPAKYELEIRKLTAVCERLELEHQIKLGQYHTNEDCKLWVGKAMTAVRTILLAIPSKMAPVVEMRPKEECEPLLRDAIDEALIVIHEREWPTGTPPT